MEEDAAKKELNAKLRQAAQDGQTILDKGREMAAAGQSIIDWASALDAVVPYVHSTDALGKMSLSWSLVNRNASSVVGQLAGIMVPSLVTSTGISAYTSLVEVVNSVHPHLMPVDQQRLAIQAVDRVLELASQPDLRAEVAKLLEHLDLHLSRGAERSPLEQFLTAHSAFEKPVDDSDPAITSLLPMRSCIETALAWLLQRRTMQEPTGKHAGKIRSILQHLKHPYISNEHIESLSDEGSDLVENQLSHLKNEKIDRDVWRSRLSAATIWLKAFLGAIDKGRMRAT